MIKFTIKGQLPTSNQIISASKSHFIVYSKMKKRYTTLVMLSTAAIPVIKNKSDLMITWYRKDRRSDPDNIAGGIKFILDGMVEAGKLENDGWKQINSISHKFAIDKDNPRVEITISEQEEEKCLTV